MPVNGSVPVLALAVAVGAREVAVSWTFET
jgi:hypothetical protein